MSETRVAAKKRIESPREQVSNESDADFALRLRWEQALNIATHGRFRQFIQEGKSVEARWPVDLSDWHSQLNLFEYGNLTKTATSALLEAFSYRGADNHNYRMSPDGYGLFFEFTDEMIIEDNMPMRDSWSLRKSRRLASVSFDLDADAFHYGTGYDSTTKMIAGYKVMVGEPVDAALSVLEHFPEIVTLSVRPQSNRLEEFLGQITFEH